MASTTYTKTDVAQHNTTNNCWVTYNGGVYDITTYILVHNQQYYDITAWCGGDITSNFDSIGKHRGSATTLLASFKIGTLVTTTTTATAPTTTTNTTTTEVASNTTVKLNNPYNLLLPLLLGIILYWGSLLLFSKNIKQFNAFWNTALLLTLLIPTFGFGVFMILQYQFPSLRDIDFKFLYWHVEFSVFMGVLAISHFIRRSKVYLMQLKQK
jgi:predicted heme/steroid binding protein